ncbi:MAG: ASCH domain-containing protein, partial [Thermoprotei archaeon]
MVKGEYVDLILKGVKRTTIRLGIIKPKYNKIMIHGGGKPIALAKITNVEYKRINELTDEDARKDGFPSLK